MNISIEWLLGILFALVFGSFAWTAAIAYYLSSVCSCLRRDVFNKIDLVSSELHSRIDDLRDNDIKHFDERLRKLELAK